MLKYCVKMTMLCLFNKTNEMSINLKTTQNLNQQNNAEILCKNDYALSF